MIVDFYADWCIPCKEIPSILKKVKNELKETVRIVKVNVDKNPLIASKYKINSVPTIMIFKNGLPQWKSVGVGNADELKEVLQNYIKNS